MKKTNVSIVSGTVLLLVASLLVVAVPPARAAAPALTLADPAPVAPGNSYVIAGVLTQGGHRVFPAIVRIYDADGNFHLVHTTGSGSFSKNLVAPSASGTYEIGASYGGVQYTMDLKVHATQ